jgi:hypothetical protein
MTTQIDRGPRAGDVPQGGALALRPFLDVCLASGVPALVEAGRESQPVGLVEVREGRVWRCIHQDHEGDRALAELLEERFDEIVVRRGTGARTPRNVFAPAFPGPASAGEAGPPAGTAEASGEETSRFASTWDAGVSALLRKDLPAALEAFQAAARLRPEDPSVKANLARLGAMGFGAGT